VESNNTEDATKNSKSIKISNVRASDNKLQVELDISGEITKYFFKNSFEVTYDRNIEDVDESILAIPAVCAIVQVAWATGADLYVEKLDETFLSSILKIRKVFERFYPKFSSSGNIHVQKTIANKFNNTQTALLFSGGLDSIVSYIRNKDERPILITLLKPGNSNYNKIKDFHLKFAEQEGMEIHFLESNMWDNISDFTNNRLLGDEFKTKDWWGHVSHGLILLGLCVPLTVERIGKIIFASTYPKNYSLPHGSHFLDYTDGSWADVNIVNDSSDLTRQGKIRYVLKRNPLYQKYVRSCLLSNEGGTNFKECGYCEKCLRTITGMILEGIEPNECNFDVKNNVFDYIKNLFISGSLYTDLYFWQDIQSNISDIINNDEISQRYQAKQFFEWLREFDFANYKQPNSFFHQLKHYYYSIKYNGIDYTRQKIRINFSKISSNKK